MALILEQASPSAVQRKPSVDRYRGNICIYRYTDRVLIILPALQRVWKCPDHHNHKEVVVTFLIGKLNLKILFRKWKQIELHPESESPLVLYARFEKAEESLCQQDDRT